MPRRRPRRAGGGVGTAADPPPLARTCAIAGSCFTRCATHRRESVAAGRGYRKMRANPAPRQAPVPEPGLTSERHGGTAQRRSIACEWVLMTSFSIISRRSAGVHFLTPVGRLDGSTAPMLQSEYDAVARGSAALIVLNLSRLSMLTPAGIEVLLRINAREDNANRLRVINGSRPVARALEITGARERLPVMSPRTADPTPI